jgi:hypothetical protein
MSEPKHDQNQPRAAESARALRFASLRDAFVQRFLEAKNYVNTAIETNKKDDFKKALSTLSSSLAGLQRILNSFEVRILKPRLKKKRKKQKSLQGFKKQKSSQGFKVKPFSRNDVIDARRNKKTGIVLDAAGQTRATGSHRG